MHFFFAWEYHALLKMLANHWTVASRFSLDVMFEISRARVLSVMALMKFFSFSLSLLIDQKELSMLVSLILTSIIRETWSEGLRNSGWREYWPNPELLGLMKAKSMIELVSHRLSTNLVGPGLMGDKRSRPRLSARVSRFSV